MILLESTASIIILGVAILLHIATQIIDGILAKILAFVNIALHISLFIPLILDAVPIEEAVLAYTASAFFYTAASYVRHLIATRNAGEGERDDL